MAYCQRLIAAVLAALFAYTPTAWAAYASAPTPPGFGGSPGAWKVAAQAGDTTFQNLLKKAPFIPKDYGGTVAKLGSGYRFGAPAARVAASVLVGNPALLLGAGAVGLALWVASAKVRYSQSSGTWEQEVEGGAACTVAPCYEYRLNAYGVDTGWLPTKAATCPAFAAGLTLLQPYGYWNTGVLEGEACRIKLLSSAGLHQNYLLEPSTRSVDPAPPGSSYEPITPQQAQDKIAAQPMPSTVPLELPPGTQLPIEGEPVNNPGPGTNMTPQAVRVPVGDPVRQSDGTYKQPYVDIVPTPTTSDPWRVDVRPGDKVTTDGAPLPEPAPVNPTDPNPDPNAPPVIDPNDPTTKTRDPALQDLCEKHPGIAACAPYKEPEPPPEPVDPCVENPDRLGCMPPGELSAEPVANEDKQITLTPDGGWGSAGVCPPPRQITLSGGMSFQIPLDLICDFARMIRPLVVAMAYLGAAMMLVGAARRE